MAYLKQDNYDEAVKYLEKAQNTFLSIIGHDCPDTRKTQKWLDYAMTEKEKLLKQ